MVHKRDKLMISGKKAGNHKKKIKNKIFRYLKAQLQNG